MPGVAAADYVSITQRYPWLIPVQDSEFKFNQWNHSLGLWFKPRHVTNIIYRCHPTVIQHILDMNGYVYWDSHQSRSQLGADVRVVLTADVVATCEQLNHYFDSANFGISPTGSARACSA